jgi:hypothetical protein
MHMIGCRGRRFSVSAETKPGTVMPHGSCHELPPKPPICRDRADQESHIPHRRMMPIRCLPPTLLPAALHRCRNKTPAPKKSKLESNALKKT